MAKKLALSFREQIEGFPFAQVLLIAVVRLAEPIAFSSLFPYVYFMVRNFLAAEKENEISTYSGYLATAFAACQVCCALQWGRAAERLGRKTIIMTGLVGTALAMLLLGFSKSYYMALLARALMGCVNGNVAIIKTMLGELATKRDHQALAFTVMPLCHQLGTVIGPMLGGFLTNNVSKLKDPYKSGELGFANGTAVSAADHSWLSDLNAEYPFAFVNIVISVILFTSAIIAFLFIEETHFKIKYRYDLGLAIGDQILSKLRIRKTKKKRHWTFTNEERDIIASQEEGLLGGTSDTGQEEESGHQQYRDNSTLYQDDIGVNERASENALGSAFEDDVENGSARIQKNTRNEQRSSLFDKSVETQSIPWRKLVTPNLVNILIVFFLQNVQDTVYAEFMPIFLSYDLELDSKGYLKSKFPFHLVGGLGFSSAQTGKLLSVTGLLGIFIVVVIFPYVDRTYHPKNILKVGFSIIPIYFLSLPYVLFLAPNTGNKLQTFKLANLFLYSLAFIRTCCVANIKPQISLIVHRGAPKAYKAVVNSMVVTTSSASRAVGPLVYGHVFSYAQKHEIAWLPWWSLFAFSIGIFIQTFFMDTTERDEDFEEDEEVVSEPEIRSVASTTVPTRKSNAAEGIAIATNEVDNDEDDDDSSYNQSQPSIPLSPIRERRLSVQ